MVTRYDVLVAWRTKAAPKNVYSEYETHLLQLLQSQCCFTSNLFRTLGIIQGGSIAMRHVGV